MNEKQHPEYLTINELAALSGMKPRRLRHLVSTGKMPFIQERPGKKIHVSVVGLLNYLSAITEQKNNRSGNEVFKSGTLNYE